MMKDSNSFNLLICEALKRGFRYANLSISQSSVDTVRNMVDPELKIARYQKMTIVVHRSFPKSAATKVHSMCIRAGEQNLIYTRIPGAYQAPD